MNHIAELLFGAQTLVEGSVDQLAEQCQACLAIQGAVRALQVAQQYRLLATCLRGQGGKIRGGSQRDQVGNRCRRQARRQGVGHLPCNLVGLLGADIAHRHGLQVQLVEESLAEFAQVPRRHAFAGLKQCAGGPLRAHQGLGQGAVGLAVERVLGRIAPLPLQAVAYPFEGVGFDGPLLKLLDHTLHHHRLTIAPAGEGQGNAAGVGVGLDPLAGQPRGVEYLVEAVLQPAGEQPGQYRFAGCLGGTWVLQAEAPLHLGRGEAGVGHVPEGEGGFIDTLSRALVLGVEQREVLGDIGVGGG